MPSNEKIQERVNARGAEAAAKEAAKSAQAAQTSDAAADKNKFTISYNRAGNANGKPRSNSKLSYPHEKVYDDFTDYVRFRFVKYNPPFAAKEGKTFNDKDGNPRKLTSEEALNIYNNNISEFEDSGLPSIFMYMPEDIGTEYGAEWGGKGFTNTGSDIMRTAGSLLNSESLSATVGSAIQNMGNAMQRGSSLAADVVATAINKLPGKIGGSVDMNDVLGGIGGVILNPNAELLFSGFELRNFGLQFKMAPRNKTEAEVIRDIITTFKRASLPQFGAAPGNSLSNIFNKKGTTSRDNANNRNFIGVPNLCIVEFMKGTNPHPYLTQYKPCAIKSVQVSYTPDGQYTTYADGSPVATSLSLAFTESKLVYSNEITYGGASY